MILIDTNVISVLSLAESPIDAWSSRQDRRHLVISSISVTEVRFGLSRMPTGQRRTAAELAWSTLEQEFGRRIIPISHTIADMTGVAMAMRESIGRPMNVSDALIAGTALVLGVPLATRNVKDFTGLGIEIIDPWGA